jgi:ABC-2 type transport system permease protein
MLALFQVVAIPDAEAIQQVATLMESMPPALVRAFGGEDVAFMGTPDGYLAVQFFGFGLLILTAYSVTNGLNVTVNDEDRNIMDSVLSLPLARWQIIIEKFAAYALLTVMVVAMTFGGIWLATLLTPSVTYNLDRIALATFNMLPSMVLVLATTIFIGAVIRSRTVATALASAFVIGSYFLDAIGLAVGDESSLSVLRRLTFYGYYDGVEVVRSGMAWGNVALLLAISALLVGLSVYFFQRRDVSV